MYNVRSNPFSDTPPVVKNLIYINVIMFLASWVAESRFQTDLNDLLGAHYFTSHAFNPVQLVTYMFMHANLPHIFFNMFGLWMFGRVLESVWGSKRFFIYYFVTGLGAIGIHMLVQYFEFSHIAEVIKTYSLAPNFETFQLFINKNITYPSSELLNFVNDFSVHKSDPLFLRKSSDILFQYYNEVTNVTTVGASGSIFGVLLAFGMLFPNTELMLLFPPIPIKAKYFVIGYGLIELYSGFAQPGSNIAHFAHLGGMLFGFILIKYWNTKRTIFY